MPEKAKPNGDGRTNEGKADFRNTCLKEDVEAALKRSRATTIAKPG